MTVNLHCCHPGCTDTRDHFHGLGGVVHWVVPNGPNPLHTKIDARVNAADTPDAERAIMLDLLWKFARGDWHGVSDAANDLRVEEAKRGK